MITVIAKRAKQFFSSGSMLHATKIGTDLIHLLHKHNCCNLVTTKFPNRNVKKKKGKKHIQKGTFSCLEVGEICVYHFTSFFNTMEGAQCFLPREATAMHLASTVWHIVCAAQLTFSTGYGEMICNKFTVHNTTPNSTIQFSFLCI